MTQVRRRTRLRDIGSEPDYRFTLANERTFLAWLRTALSLLAGGVAVAQLVPDLAPEAWRTVLGTSLVILSMILAAFSYRRWYQVEKAMRLGGALPFSALPLILSVGVAVVVVIVVALLFAT